jgi:oligoendopeptidase F
MPVATAAPPTRKFVPVDIDLSDAGQIEPLYRTLLARPVESTAELEAWLADYSELTAAISEFASRRYIDKSCHTDDPAIQARYLHFIENVQPVLQPLWFEMQKKLLSSPAAASLDEKRFATMVRHWRADVELFRQENVPLQTESAKVSTEFDKLNGAMTVTFDGREQTPQQMAKYGEQPDRAVREQAWRLVADRRLQNRDAYDGLFEQLIGLRHQMAVNAGLSDYRAFAWVQKHRFDYTPDHCLAFADAIEAVCVPAVRQLDERRRADLGLAALRPWDLSVDPKGRPPLTPFREGDIDSFVSKTKSILQGVSPELAEQFESLREHGNLDLDSRRGKQPGGYQSSLNESRRPFIFMNAAGLQRDVDVLLHEAGHAFHYIAACQTQPLVFLRHAPLEFCEVASMGMELLGADHYEAVYPQQADADRARRALLEGIVRFLPWMATIDLFQHWIYTHPGHARAERTNAWLGIIARFGRDVDWTGFEAARASSWQQQVHLFNSPFYYIEYGIAQVGALQLWRKSREDPRRALSNYRAALNLGGTRPLPELFAAAGVRFDFTERTLRPLVDAVMEELDALPA